MTGYTHVLAGALMVSALAGPEANMGLLVAGSAGALAADLDTFASPAARTLAGSAAAAALQVMGVRHRGPTHSIAALFIFGFLVRVGAAMLGNVPAVASLPLNVPAYGSALILGYVSHLVMDMFTPSGCPLLWPFVPGRYTWLGEKLGLRTGGAIESLFLRPLLTLALIVATSGWILELGRSLGY